MIKKIARRIMPIVISVVAATAVMFAYSYFVQGKGFPAANELKKADIASVQISQGSETITLTKKEDIEQAVDVVNILCFRFGEAGGGTADTTYEFYLEDGSMLKIGANRDTIFKDGKQYAGVSDSCRLFGNCTQAIFYYGTLRDGKLYN